MQKIESCPICNRNQFSNWLTCTDYFYSKEQFQLFRCKGCDFIFTQNVPDEDEMGKYYTSDDYVSHSDTKKGFVNRVYHYVREFMLSRKYAWVKSASRKNKGELLDIGAGTGYFLNYVKHKGWSVYGVEQSSSARDYADSSFSINMLSSIEEAKENFKENSFDVITLWHVLEHVEHLEERIAIFSSLLKDDGLLVIAVPNCSSYDAEHYKEFWAAYDVPRHLWHFTPKTFTLLASKCGYLLHGIKPMHFDPFYISMMSEKYKGSSLGMLRGVAVGFLSFVKGVFYTDKCSSVVYLLKKKHTTDI